MLLAGLVWFAAQNSSAQTVDTFSGYTDPGGYVYALAIQSDDKILVGGAFKKLAGQVRNYLGRLNADGTPDATFNSGITSPVMAIGVLWDGKIIVGGDFSNLPGNRGNLIRLNTDGSFDDSFAPNANGTVRFILVQSNDQILVGGQFSGIGGHSVTNIAKLNADGNTDLSFVAETDGTVASLALQPDGKIIAGGSFAYLSGVQKWNLGRLNSDGTPDAAFVGGAGNVGEGVSALAIQLDNEILVAGNFNSIGNSICHNIGRLYPDGTLKDAFGSGTDSEVRSVVVQTDGKIIVGGMFTRLLDQPRNHIGRLNADGSLDESFIPDINGWAVNALAMQPDGKLVVGGAFTGINGIVATNLSRINSVGALTDDLSFDGSTVVWQRSGAIQEVQYTSFDVCTNGNDWQSIGTGTRVAGGWKVSDVLYRLDTTVQARGLVGGGLGNGSSWFVQHAIGKPAVAVQPTDRTNLALTTASFTVKAVGTNVVYQWIRNGVSLADGTHVFGSQTGTLTITNVLGDDSAWYAVILSNGAGNVTSRVATLTVRDPIIGLQPTNKSISLGQSSILSVMPVGTPPFSYQWRHAGIDLAAATSSSLQVTNAQASDSGEYYAVISNQFGIAFSTSAMLTVNVAMPDSMYVGVSNIVRAVLIQPNGKILMAGDFTIIGGQPRLRIAQINADGTLDQDFNIDVNGPVYCLALQSDGKLLLAGAFTTCGGQARSRIARLNEDHTLDLSFNPAANARVSSMAIQNDGSIVVGGIFSTLGGTNHTCLGRIGADGTIDRTFNPSANGDVVSILMQPKGKIAVGGAFTMLNMQTRHYLGQINVDGSIDADFDPAPNSTINSLSLQRDGQILVGGSFTRLAGQLRAGIASLSPDGVLGSDLNPGGSATVTAIVVQSDGKIIIGGAFSTFLGQSRRALARLNPDGTLDPTFNPGADAAIYTFAIQPDGALLVGGGFATLGGVRRDYVGRLTATSPATQALVIENEAVQWTRSGSGPEVWRASLEAEIGPKNWISLEAGDRTTNGWTFPKVSIPPSSSIRVRGYTSSDHASGFVEQILSLPEIILDDSYFGFHSNGFGFHVKGSPGQVVVIETSANLTWWFPLRTNVLSYEPLTFLDPDSTILDARYYRTRLQP
jgi:uncharacterized delta-60 repeat protein